MRLAVAFLACLIPLASQQQKEAAAPKREAAPPTNLKVLKLTTGAEVNQVMRTFTAGLGVQCSYCHAQGNYASDDNPKKDEARKMIRLAQKINADFSDNKMHVTCFTCHRGEAQPKTAPDPTPR